MNIDPTNNPMQYLNSGDKKSPASDTADRILAGDKSNVSAQPEKKDIQLSQQSKQIQQIHENLKASDGIDREKVADVKKRLAAIQLDIQQNGPRLESATQRIADKIIDMDELLSKK